MRRAARARRGPAAPPLVGAAGRGLSSKFCEDNGTQLAGLMAYYGFFSLFPLLLVLVTVLGLVLRGDATPADTRSSTPRWRRSRSSARRSQEHPLAQRRRRAARDRRRRRAVGRARGHERDARRAGPHLERRRHAAHTRSSSAHARASCCSRCSARSTWSRPCSTASSSPATARSRRSARSLVSLALDFGLFVAVFVLLTSYPATVREILPGRDPRDGRLGAPPARRRLPRRARAQAPLETPTACSPSCSARWRGCTSARWRCSTRSSSTWSARAARGRGRWF